MAKKYRQIVTVIRNPKDVIVSKISDALHRCDAMGWTDFKNIIIADISLAIRNDIADYQKFYNKIVLLNPYIINFDDLIKSPAKAIKDLASYHGHEFTEKEIVYPGDHFVGGYKSTSVDTQYYDMIKKTAEKIDFLEVERLYNNIIRGI